ncbi:MAG: SDR family NAD(P)-dependent oxidoreductase [Gemmatimonadaceae bacterium]|nr:SDR family NAD(P)-dependent oxidoreductase [Gemmatimonadaceae bacterium]
MATIFLTGAAGGFGRLITLAVRRQGHRVIGTVRDLAGRNAAAAAELRAAGAEILEMDVTDDASVNAAVDAAIAHAGTIDVVVNNAGLGVIGVQEAFTAADLQRVFDINVVGAHRVTRAATPHLRANGRGLVLFISSLLGRIAVPFYGPYNASKWALEGLAENYSLELSGFGIDVAIVEPGGFPTSFIPNLLTPGDRARVAALQPLSDTAAAFLRGFEQSLAAAPSQDPALVGEAIVGLVEAAPGTRPFRTIVDTIGMGAAVGPYNAHLATLTSGLFGHLGLGGLLARRGADAGAPGAAGPAPAVA